MDKILDVPMKSNSVMFAKNWFQTERLAVSRALGYTLHTLVNAIS